MSAPPPQQELLLFRNHDGNVPRCTGRSRRSPTRARWKDVSTLLACYQQADDAMLLEVMSESRKRSELKRDDLRVSPGVAG